MARTRGQMTSKHSTIEVAADEDGPWTSLDMAAISFSADGGAHQSGTVNIFGSTIPLVALANKEAVTATIGVVYTEVASESYDLLEAYFESQNEIFVRSRPEGASGDWQFVGSGFVLNQPVPEQDATSADILRADFELILAELERQDQST